MEERKPSHSTEETTKSNNPENAVSEQSNETENAIYPDWTSFQCFFGRRTMRQVSLTIKTSPEIKEILTPEALNHYSKRDYRKAERKFLKYVLEHRRIENEEDLLER